MTPHADTPQSSRWLRRFSVLLVLLGWLAAIASYAPLAAARISVEYAGVFLPAALLTFGQFALATGLALYLSCRFAHGFSALDRFFDAILQRTQSPAAPAPDLRPPKNPQTCLVNEGYLGERPFALYADGGVDVDTLLGRRRFESLEAARQFVGNADLRRADGRGQAFASTPARPPPRAQAAAGA